MSLIDVNKNSAFAQKCLAVLSWGKKKESVHKYFFLNSTHFVIW